MRDALVRGRGSWRLSNGAVRGTLVVVLENDDEVRVRVSLEPALAPGARHGRRGHAEAARALAPVRREDQAGGSTLSTNRSTIGSPPSTYM